MDYVIASVTALATIVLTFLTYRYVRLTHSILEEMRKARKQIIIIDFIKRIGHYQTKIDMIISNKSLSAAKEISFETDKETNFVRDIIDINGKPSGKAEVIAFNRLSIFEDVIPYLPPGNNISFNI